MNVALYSKAHKEHCVMQRIRTEGKEGHQRTMGLVGLSMPNVLELIKNRRIVAVCAAAALAQDNEAEVDPG